MGMSRIGFRGCVALALGILLAVAFSTPSSAEKVSLRLNWRVYGEHAPFWAGLEHGVYKKHGIDVKIGPSKGSGHAVQLLANKNDDYGYADTGAIITGISKGMKIKSIGTFLQSNPMAILSLEGPRAIRTVADIKGKKLAVVAGDSLHNLWPAITSRNKIKDGTYELVFAPSPAAKVIFTLKGKTDATITYVSVIPWMEGASKKKAVVLSYPQLGVQTLSQGLFAHMNTLKTKPELTRRMVRATVEAWEFADKNPEVSVKALVKHNPKQKFGSNLKGWNISRGLMFTPRSKGRRPGFPAKADWNGTIKLLYSTKPFEGLKPFPLSRYFTDEFLPRN